MPGSGGRPGSSPGGPGTAIAGTLAGKRIADRVSGRGLTIAFAVLLVALAGYVLARGLPALLYNGSPARTAATGT